MAGCRPIAPHRQGAGRGYRRNSGARAGRGNNAGQQRGKSGAGQQRGNSGASRQCGATAGQERGGAGARAGRGWSVPPADTPAGARAGRGAIRAQERGQCPQPARIVCAVSSIDQSAVSLLVRQPRNPSRHCEHTAQFRARAIGPAIVGNASIDYPRNSSPTILYHRGRQTISLSSPLLCCGPPP